MKKPGLGPSREDNLLSDFVFSIFGRTLTISSQEQIFAVLIVAMAFAAWAVLQFRRRRTVVLERSPASDQIHIDLARIADALERLANRPVERPVAQASSTQPDERHSVAYSMFGR